MGMKRCSICKEEKGCGEFNKHSGRKDGLQSHCRDCNKARSKEYYRKNPEIHKRNVVINKQKYASEIQSKIIEYLNSHPCVDCGYSNILALEFDHLYDKKIAISQAVSNGWSWNNILLEIEKCEVRCSNCHKIKTATEGNFYKLNRV